MPRHTRDELQDAMRRRTFLQAGTLSGLGLSLPGLFAGRARAAAPAPDSARAKAAILLFATGGPAQQETFDPKPDAEASVRGEFDPIDTSAPGVRICELLPMMARNAHRYAVIRSTYHNSGTHGVGVHWNLTGQEHLSRDPGEPQVSRKDPPCLGGAVRQLRGDRNGLPGAVHLPVRIGDQNNFQWGGQHAGFLGPEFDPLMLIDETWNPGTMPTAFLPPKDVPLARQAARAKLLAGFEQDRPDENAKDFRRFREQAQSVLGSTSAWEAFLVDRESPETLARYGDNKFGRSCLVARRLVEAGVSLVTVPWMRLTSNENFDTHSKHFRTMKELLMPVVDRAFSALLEDLAARGMLDETLVIWTGEFGRTPKINGGAGRDHWGQVYSTVLAGGGIKGGVVHGSSDKIAGVPASDPVHTKDFFATIYQALGYGPDTMVFDAGGRPHPIVKGRAVETLF